MRGSPLEPAIVADARRDHLDDMLKIAGAFSCEGSPSVALNQLLDAIAEILECEMCAVHLIDPDQQSARLTAFKAAECGIPDCVVQMTEVESLDAGYMAQARERKPYQPSDPLTAERLSDLEPNIHALGGKIAKVPLFSGEKFVGVLTVFRNRGVEGWFEREQEWLGAMGNLIGLLIDQMDMFEHFRCSSIIEERERLSQEVHDNLTQMVGAIRVLSEQMMENAKTGNFDRLENDAEMLLQLAGDAYTSCREEIRGLRAHQPLEGDAFSQIGDYLDRFGRQWGVRTSFSAPAHKVPIPPYASAQLYRIVQESLVNVRKHARASKVTVRAIVRGAAVRVEISDDGVGFDPAEVPEHSFGLRIMEERARDAGIVFSVDSTTGKGTVVAVDVPLGGVGWGRSA